MVKIIVCTPCRLQADKTGHLDLYSTGRSLIFGCPHAIEDLKREIDEEVQSRLGHQKAVPVKPALDIVRYSKIEYRQGKFYRKGHPLPIDEEPPADFRSW